MALLFLSRQRCKALQNVDELSEKVFAIIDLNQTCALATLTKNNKPEVSLTPFIYIDEHFYLFISDLASHTENLRTQEKCSLLISEPIKSTDNSFAQKRLSLTGRARFIDVKSQSHEPILSKFEEKHGPTVSLLKTLPDFHLVEIEITNGRFIEGFGKAFAFDRMSIETAQLDSGK